MFRDFSTDMNKALGRKIREFILRESAELGFSSCGIAKAEYLEEEAPRLEKWLKAGMHGEMHYMANHFDLRLDVRKLVPGAKSVVVLLFNYFPANEISLADGMKISKYAYGQDYHKVLRKKLKKLIAALRENFGEINGRAFVDSAPVMERVWAKKAGLGWIGKNSLLLSKQKGSFFFLSELILDVDIETDSPVTDHCGRCTACIDACPTQAITSPFTIDANRCISYLTIELKNQIPEEFKGKMEQWVFGCDICQDVCPWNRFSSAHDEAAFLSEKHLTDLVSREWLEMTEEVFEKLFTGSPIKRTGLSGIKRNVSFLSS